MPQTPDPTAVFNSSDASEAGAASAEHWMSELGQLLHQLESVGGAGPSVGPVFSPEADTQLIQVRLGDASSLFAALQCKHPPMATHSLRVALTCSAWASYVPLDERLRDALEVAALLHDVGMIGTPDHLLLKPIPLSPDEASVITESRQMSLAILRRSCAVPAVLEMVEYATAWYDGTRNGFARKGVDLPIGARMIAIAEAFDAMTTNHVFRPAMTEERALAELFEGAGTQFDPELVRSFAEFREKEPGNLHAEVASRWLQSIDPEQSNAEWRFSIAAPNSAPQEGGLLFQEKLLENMYDAVMFLDADARIVLWNRGAERLTGVSRASVDRRRWTSELLQMCDERGQPVSEADCPVDSAIGSGIQSLRRLTIAGRTGRAVAVDAHAIPVIADDGSILGAVLLFHDASSETTLEQRCQSLHEKATRDPLTQVANRAEFDRVLEMFVATHQEHNVPCSLIMMDLDRFKSVNDQYGHQAGDDALITLAQLLKSMCRAGDLVARYGGEEFVMLCADCDSATVAHRAEQIRQSLANKPQRALDGRAITASFGVTEIQPGDTPETMLRRADRALMMAKSQGRNRVVQLGSGSTGEPSQPKPGSRGKAPTDAADFERTLVTSVPIQIAIEKLRGFVADHKARILKVERDLVELIINERSVRQRRSTDRLITFQMSVQFKEVRRTKGPAQEEFDPVRTSLYVKLAPKRRRDRREANLEERARGVILSFQSYLMATEIPSESVKPKQASPVARAGRLLIPWRGRR